VSRVVFCSQNLGLPEDPRVWKEAVTLAGAGHTVTAIGPARARSRRDVIDGVEILRYPEVPALPGVLGQLTETANALLWTAVLCVWLSVSRRERIDVLHAANPPDTFFLVGLLLRPLGTRFVFDQHDACPELLRSRSGSRPLQERLLRVFERASYATAHLVIAPNSSYRHLALDRGTVSADAVVVVRSGPLEVTPPPHSVDDAAAPVVVSFGGMMGPQDGVDVLVDAAALVLSRRPGSIVVDLVGSGDEVDALRSRAGALGVGASVRFTGWLDGAAYRERLSAASIAVSPDRDDTFTRLSTMTKIGDYLALGLPTVAADLPENRVTAGEAARYFAPGDASDLARALEELVDDPGLRRELRARALERAPALTWKHGGERLVAAYKWLLEGGPPVAPDQIPTPETDTETDEPKTDEREKTTR
jgi:glycosyltransferase involved in cell wall biosynthesis